MTHTMSVCKTSEIWIRSLDFISISFFILILYYNYTRCYHCGKLDEAYTGYLCGFSLRFYILLFIAYLLRTRCRNSVSNSLDETRITTLNNVKLHTAIRKKMLWERDGLYWHRLRGRFRAPECLCDPGM